MPYSDLYSFPTRRSSDLAKMLDLDYPGGPHIAKLAEQGNSGRFTFPRPMVDRPGLDFSFSGLKTYTLNTVAAHAQADGLPDRSEEHTSELKSRPHLVCRL